MSDARTKREQFLPWAWAKFGFRFDVVSATLDGARPAAIDAERRMVDLDEAWETATLDLEVEAPAEVYTRLLPPKDLGRIAAVVVIRCDQTHLRHGERLRLPRSGGVVKHRLALRRSDFAGTIELGTVLVRETAAPARVAGFAAASGARLADTRPWDLRVDRRRTLSGVYLDVRYRSFKSDETIPKRERGNLCRLEVAGDTPILWLNNDHAAVVAILNAKGHVGRRAVLRDVAFDTMVPLVWVRLFIAAANQLRATQEAAYPWQEAVLDTVARLLFPERRDTAEARGRLESDLEDLPSVLERLDGALQEEHNVASHLVRLTEELE